MPTLSAGVSTEVYVPVSGSMTVTPGAGGRVRVDVSVRQGMAPVDVVSPIHSARTFSVPGGATVFLEAIGAAASYSSVPGDGNSGLARFGGLAPLGRPSGTVQNQKTCTSHMAKMALYPMCRLSGVVVYYDNPGATDIVVSGAIQLQSGTKLQLTFADGAATKTLKPGEVAATNEVPVYYGGPSSPQVAADALFLRTYITLASGTLACRTATVYYDGGAFPTGARDMFADNGGTDLTMGADTGLSSVLGYMYSPLAVVGRPLSYTGAVVAAFGDSIGAGQGDTASITSGGWMRRFCNRRAAPSYQMGMPGRQWPVFDPLSDGAQALLLLRGANNALLQFGTNDFGSGSSLATVQARARAVCAVLQSWGCKPWLATLPPRTTSTDSWATPGNQTAFSANFAFGSASPRALYNAWVRSLPIEGAGYIEVADYLETERDSGIWKNSHTSDGTHPNGTGYDAIDAGNAGAAFP